MDSDALLRHFVLLGQAHDIGSHRSGITEAIAQFAVNQKIKDENRDKITPGYTLKALTKSIGLFIRKYNSVMKAVGKIYQKSAFDAIKGTVRKADALRGF